MGVTVSKVKCIYFKVCRSSSKRYDVEETVIDGRYTWDHYGGPVQLTAILQTNLNTKRGGFILLIYELFLYICPGFQYEIHGEISKITNHDWWKIENQIIASVTRRWYTCCVFIKFITCYDRQSLISRRIEALKLGWDKWLRLVHFRRRRPYRNVNEMDWGAWHATLWMGFYECFIRNYTYADACTLLWLERK